MFVHKSTLKHARNVFLKEAAKFDAIMKDGDGANIDDSLTVEIMRIGNLDKKEIVDAFNGCMKEKYGTLCPYVMLSENT